MESSAVLPADRIDLLMTFVRIVEAGSLSAAAAQLRTTQPTVSRRLQALERLLDQRLLHRSTHRMTLTAEGERCLEQARGLLMQWEGLQDDMRGASAEPRGELRVVVPHAFGQAQLVEPLVQFLARYPKVSVEWLLHDQEPDLSGQRVDCAIHIGAVDDPTVIARHVADVPRVVVASPSLAKSPVTDDVRRELAALPWLALKMFYRDEVVLYDQAQQRLAFPIQPRVVTDSLHALHHAALAGAGAAIMSTWLAVDDLALGRLVQLAPGWEAPPLPVYLVYPKASFYPARLRLFLDVMREAMPRIAGVRRRS